MITVTNPHGVSPTPQASFVVQNLSSNLIENINDKIAELKQFFAKKEQVRYIYSSSQTQIIRYLEKLVTLMPHVLKDLTNQGYEQYLSAILQGLQNLTNVLKKWNEVLACDPSSEARVCGLYKSHLEGARQGYKATKRKLQRLEDLNIRLEKNQKKSENVAKKFLLLRDSLQKIADSKILSVVNSQGANQTQIIKRFIELFLSSNVLLGLNDEKQILWIQGSLIGVINHGEKFAIDEYFKILMSNATRDALSIAHGNYAALITRACSQLEIKSQISINPNLYLEPITQFFKNELVTKNIIGPNQNQYKPSRLYQTTEQMAHALMQLLLYMPQEQFESFIVQNISLFKTRNGFELALNAWLQLFTDLEKDRFNEQLGRNILSAIDVFLLPDNHTTSQMMYNYMQSVCTEKTQTMIAILALKTKRILDVTLKHPEHIKYFFTPGFKGLFSVQYEVDEAPRKQWATAWFYFNAHSPLQIEVVDSNLALTAAQEIFPMFSRLHVVWPEALVSLINFFQTIVGYGNWKERQELAKYFARAFDEVENADRELSKNYLQSIQATIVVKLFDLPTMCENIGIFKQLASIYLLHFCKEAQIERLLELNSSLQPCRAILQFPLQENFDLLYYFSDKLTSMEDKLAPGDSIWAMKLLYHIFADINASTEDMSHYIEHVNDLLESVQRFSQFYQKYAAEMPSRVLQNVVDFNLWQLELPPEYVTSLPTAYGHVQLMVQGNLIDYKLLDCDGKARTGQLNAVEIGLELPANAGLVDLMRIKDQLFAAIASKTDNLGWQALLMKQYLRLKDTVREQILTGFASLPDTQTTSFRDKIRDAILIIDGTKNYKFSIIDSVVSKYLIEGLTAANVERDITIFFDAMVGAIAKALSRQNKTLVDWRDAAHSVDDRVKFICARKKYSENQFKEWFGQMNEQLAADKNAALMGEYLPAVRTLNEQQQQLFASLGIDFLQYNQEIAIASVYQHLSAVKERGGKMNLFMKLGTGQGKSLVIAESARKILSEKLAKKVMIFTCYDHLAERDFNKFQSYFAHFGYKAAVILPSCLDSSIGAIAIAATAALTEFSQAQIVYVNLETYIALLRQERTKRAKQQDTRVVFPDASESVAIMDEFDSLVLDSDEIGQILDRFSVPNANLLQLGKNAAENKLLADLDSNSIVKPLLKTTIGINAWKNWYDYQWEQLAAGDRRHNNVSSLGKSQHYKSALLDGYPSGQVSLLASIIDPLSFYNSFKFVIGLSGSITKQTHVLTTKVLTGDSSYFEIPPFFGPVNAEKNRIQTKELICDTQAQHIQCIVDEAIAINQTERPVLIFAESVKRGTDNKSDFEALKESLGRAAEISGNKLLVVETENDIKRHLPSIGKRKYVTIATRILARGADIKVDIEVHDGLHLVVGYYPTRESIYIQMLGRTARQDDKGSYAVIARSKAAFKAINSEKNVVNAICHKISEVVFSDEKLPKAEQTGRQYLSAFPLFLTALWSGSSLALQGRDAEIESQVNQAFPKLRRF